MDLSIIVPVYNGEEYLKECLDSIAAQTFKDYELVIVDDGSKDRSPVIIDEFISIYPDINIKKIRKENAGLSQARKTGVENAQGKYIGFVDADDYISKDYFENFMVHANNTNADIITSDFTERRDNKDLLHIQSEKFKKIKLLDSYDARIALLNRQAVYQYAFNKIFKRQLFENINFSEEKIIGEDFYLCMQTIGISSSVCVADMNGYYYRIHGKNMTQGGFNAERKNGYEAYKRYYADFKGNDEEKNALERYLMLEYMSCLINMYRSGYKDAALEDDILGFVCAHKKDYIENSNDGVLSKVFTRLINPVSSKIFYRFWPKISEK